MRLWPALAGAALLLAACAAGPRATPAMPQLWLSPASLGGPLALQQRLTVSAAGRSKQQLDVALEIERDAVRMAVLDLGQALARLEWDGRQLRETRAAGWPAAVRGERILNEMQLVLWPPDAIQAALPLGWTLAVQPDGRTLRFDGAAVVQVRYPSRDVAELENVAEGYRIRIESRPWSAAP